MATSDVIRRGCAACVLALAIVACGHDTVEHSCPLSLLELLIYVAADAGEPVSITGSGDACDGSAIESGPDPATSSVEWQLPLPNPPRTGTCHVTITYADGTKRSDDVRFANQYDCGAYPDHEVVF